jgi:hypothetical protein
MPKARAGPDNWPEKMPYLSAPILSSDLPKDILSAAALTSASLEKDVRTIAAPTTPYSNIKITPINTPSHPACGQCGLFVTQAHPPDSFVCLYLGLVHSTKDGQPAARADLVDHAPKSDYDLSLDRDLGLAVDAATMGNEARFINDYRGIADRPNAEFRDVIVKLKGGRKERGVGVFVKAAKRPKKGKAKREDDLGLRKGEEILVSYGRGFWSARRTEAEANDEVDPG